MQLSREQILAATSRCLHQEGYDATTIRKIASLLNCAVGSIYRYFRDKHELLSIVTQQVLEPVVAANDSGESVERTARLYHQIVLSSPESYRLMFWLACQGALDTQEDEMAGPGHSRLPRVIRRIVDGWAARMGSASAERCWSMLHGLVLMGRDADACIAAMGLPEFATASGTASGADASRPAAPARREMPEIVITMTQPPAPRAATPAATVAHAAPSNEPAAVTAGAASRDGKAVASSDDVCLL
ncbi:MAG: TetR/AcrR family transcriptional regulator [Planctomycetota bacterium]|nr:TetR/AcrR family transcriptional regulator [Planctomycetota bacterium]